MGTIRTVENLAKPVKLTVSTLQLPASRLNIGSFQYNTSALTLNTAVTGVGGIDTTVAAGQIYYIYAVLSSGTVYLIGSTNSSLPAGFTLARQVGGFTTNSSSQIDQVGEYPGNLAVVGIVSAGGGLTVQPTQNFIINGGFDFWQRNTTGAASTAAGSYVSADRWKFFSVIQSVGYTGASLVRDTTPPSSNSSSAAKITMTDNRPQSVSIGQYIEAANCIPLIGKTVTLSFKVKRISVSTNSATPFSVETYYLNTKDTATTDFLSVSSTGATLISSSSITASLSSLSTSYATYTISFSVPTNASNGMLIYFRIGNSSTAIVTATGDLLSIGEVSLNIGSSASPFQRAGGTIGGELALCQRYYQTFSNGFGSTFGDSTGFYYTVPLKVNFRDLPVLDTTFFANASKTNAIYIDGSNAYTPTSQSLHDGRADGVIIKLSGQPNIAAGATGRIASAITALSAEI